MASSASAAAGIEHPENPSRRDFLYIATAAVGAVGAAAALVPLIDQMNPDAATLAAGGPVDVDLTHLGRHRLEVRVLTREVGPRRPGLRP